MKLDEKVAKFQAKQEVLAKRKEILRQDNRIAIVASVVAVALAFAAQLIYFNLGPGNQAVPEATPSSSEAADSAIPSPDLAENRIWQGSMTLAGNPVAFELDGTLAPQAVANFVSLSKDGFFENLNCHRLTTAGIYVLQCGDPNGDGTGGPGYNWGPIENAPADDVYKEGVLAMARVGGDGSSMGSQFFIVYQDSTIPSDSAGGYTVFGKITSGLDQVKQIAAKGTADGGTDGSPLEMVTLGSVAVE